MGNSQFFKRVGKLWCVHRLDVAEGYQSAAFNHVQAPCAEALSELSSVTLEVSGIVGYRCAAHIPSFFPLKITLNYKLPKHFFALLRKIEVCS